jgi:phospholipid/cholesterol/gamma-HCH transport system ATP-binding protein
MTISKERQALLMKTQGLGVNLGTINVLSNINISVVKGEFIGLIGPSGSGKSTLLKAIASIVPISAGKVLLGDYCRDNSANSISNDDDGSGVRMSLMFQEGALFDSLSVFDNVCFPLVNGTVPTSLLSASKKREVSVIVSAILKRVGLASAARKMTNELSGGMRRRVSLARALVTSPHLALLDDPTCGLDPVASSVIMDLIVEMQDELQSTVIVASHDLRRLIPRSDRLVCLWDGQVAYEGNTENLFKFGEPGVKHFVECRYEHHNCFT